MARRGVARAGLAALLVAAAGCAVVVENVTYGRGHSPYPGYGVEYVEASPAPGALLREGDTVRLTIRVRYSLLNAKRGVLKLQFDDQSGNSLLDDRIVGQEIRRSQVTEAEATQEIVVPSRAPRATQQGREADEAQGGPVSLAVVGVVLAGEPGDGRKGA